jgi:hypothetical protein
VQDDHARPELSSLAHHEWVQVIQVPFQRVIWLRSTTPFGVAVRQRSQQVREHEQGRVAAWLATPLCQGAAQSSAGEKTTLREQRESPCADLMSPLQPQHDSVEVEVLRLGGRGGAPVGHGTSAERWYGHMSYYDFEDEAALL